MSNALVTALHPIVSRVRTDVTAIKLADGSRWTNEPLTEELLALHVSGGVARGVCPIRAGESVTRLALLDFDSHKGEVDWAGMVECAQRVIDLLELDGNYPVAFRSSGGRGLHVFLIWDEPQDAHSVRVMLRSVLTALGLSDGAKGVREGQVEVFPKQDSVSETGYGNQFILPLAGKSVPLCDMLPMPREFVTALEWRASPPVDVVAKQAGRGSVQEIGVDPVSKVREALAAIPNRGVDAPDYDRWRDLAFAVWEATGGSDEGLEAFVEWSALNEDKHDEKFLRERVWPYIKAGGVTRATLYAAAGAGGWTWGGERTADGFDDVPMEVAPVVESRWRLAISGAGSELELRNGVCKQICNDKTISSIEREILAEILKQKFSTFNVKLSITACRKILTPLKGKSEQPDWLNEWVYITSEDRFFLIDSEEFLTAQGFNAKFNRLLPPQKEGEIPKSAHRVALDEYQIPTVTRATYIPFLGPLFKLNGVDCVNLYRPSSTPKAAASLSRSDREDMRLIEKHVHMLCGGRDRLAKIILSWMAYNVQNPGKKIRWAPLIKGIEGDGKSFIGQVMAAAMGRQNVKQISPNVLQSGFTSWAHGACVGVIEELRLTGHNRYDVHNALKPYLTNIDIAVHAKGKDEFTTMNTMNYIAFTNHEDALPLNENDRRFLVIFTPFKEVHQLEKEVGDIGDYFTTLYNIANDRHEQIRRWLLDYTLSSEFQPEGRAPDNADKRHIIDMNVTEEEDAFVAALDEKGIGIGDNVFVVRHLRDVAARHCDHVGAMNAIHSSKIFMKMGWSRYPKQVKWRGEVCRIWHKGIGSNPSNEDLTNLLNLTVGNAPDFENA